MLLAIALTATLCVRRADALDGSAASGATPNLSQQDIEKRFSDAKQLYKSGDLRGALRLLKECHEATHDENMHFNLAQLYRELKECEPAVSHYQLYIELNKDGERVSDAKKYLDTLKLECPTKPEVLPAALVNNADVAPPPPPSEQKREPPIPPKFGTATLSPPLTLDPGPPQSSYWPVLGWGALGLGALATAATVYEALAARQARRDVVEYQTLDKPDGSALAARQDDFFRDRTLAIVAGAVAASATGFGLYALLLRGAPQSRSRTFSAVVLPSAAMFDYRVRF